jgi:hypothetical protein
MYTLSWFCQYTSASSRALQYPSFTWSIIGPSGVRALPLAAGINEGGHYFRYLFPLVTAVVQNPRSGCRIFRGDSLSSSHFFTHSVTHSVSQVFSNKTIHPILSMQYYHTTTYYSIPSHLIVPHTIPISAWAEILSNLSPVSYLYLWILHNCNSGNSEQKMKTCFPFIHL